MKKNLFNKFWLRVGMIVAVMTTALAGTAWAQGDYSTDYTGNVTLSATGGTSASACVVKIQQGTNTVNSYDGIKAGTSSKAGAVKITVPSGTKYLHLHTAAWNNESVTLAVSPSGYSSNISLTSDSGVSGNSPFTLGSYNKASTDYYKVITFGSALTANTDLTFTATGGKRFVVWGVTAETEQGGGTQTVATPTFSPEAGTYTSAQSVTISTATSGATIYYTTDGATPTTNSSVYSSAIPVSSTTTIKAIAAKTNMTTSSVAEATYTIVSLAHAGTEADPYTVADARTLLTAAPSTTFEDVYVSGIISQVDSYNSTYKSITYWISDDGTTTDQFEVYSGKGLNGADFSSKDDLIVGSEVTVKGNIKKYNSTFEFDVNSQIVSLVEPTYPIINVENATLNLAYDATSGEIEYTITNPTSATLTAASSASWISNITVGDESVTFTTTANNGTTDREATITLSYTGAEDVTVTVTQGHYVADYATLPFEFDGGRADIEDTAGLTETGLGTDYGSSPKLKFDTTGDILILKINERPGTLTFDIKGNPGGSPSAWIGTFTIQASADGTSYSDVVSYNNLASTKESKTVNNLPADARYIKFVYEKTQGNVALGNIHLAAYVEPTGNTVTIGTQTNVASVEMWYFDSDIVNIVNGAEVEEGVEVFVQPTAAEGYEIESVTVEAANSTPVTVTENTGNWSFVMPNSSVTVNITAVQGSVTPVTGDKYVKVTSTDDLTDGQYLIVYEDGSVAFNGGLETLDAASNTISVTISNNEIAADETTEAAEVTIAAMEDGYSICSASGLYIYHTGSRNTLNTSEEAQANIITFNDGNVSITVGDYSLYFNSNSGQERFRYYKSGQQDIQLFKKVEEVVPTSQTVTVTDAGYATFVAEADLTIPADVEVFAVTVNEAATSAHLEPITGGIRYGVAVLVKASEGTYEFPIAAEEVEPLSIENDLQAALVDVTADGSQYCLAQFDGVGFYKVQAGIVIPAGKAYLQVTSSAGQAKAFYGFDDDATGIETFDNGQLTTDNGVIYNLAGQRLQKMQRGINIVNGKKILK